jgi:hypothetical protein
MNKLILIIILMAAYSYRAGACESCSATVAACKTAGYTTAKGLNTCIASQAQPSFIEACKSVGFKLEKGMNDCLYSGANADDIKTCKTIHYERARDFNDCLRACANKGE